MSDFSLSGDKVSFIVDGSDRDSNALLASLTGKAPDPSIQLVTFVGGKWASQAATFQTPSIEIAVDSSIPFQTTPIVIKIANSDSRSLEQGVLTVTAVRSDGLSISFTPRPITIAANSEYEASFDWSPAGIGDWTISAEILRRGAGPRSSTDVVLQSAARSVRVYALNSVSLSEAQQLGWSGTWLNYLWIGSSVLVLAAIAAVAGARTFGTPK
jgi:hypothetical protein